MRNLNSQEPQDANKNEKEGLLKRLANNSTVKAALLGGGILSTSAAVSACTNQVDEPVQEYVSSTKQPLVGDAFNTPVKLPAEINTVKSQFQPTLVDDGNGNWIVYYAEVNGLTGADLFRAKVNKSNPSQLVEAPMLLSTLNTAGDEYKMQIYNGKGYTLNGFDGVSTKLYSYDKDAEGKNFTNPVAVPGLNSDASSMLSFAINEANGEIYGSSFYPNEKKIYRITTGTAQEMPNCGDGVNQLEVDYVGNGNIVYSIETINGSKIMYQPLNAQGTDCLDKASYPAKRIDANTNGIQFQTNGMDQNGSFSVPEGLIYTNGDLYFAPYKQVTQTCNNGVVEGTEACDGTNLNNKACTDYGYTGGSLSCNSDCTMNTSACTNTPDGGTGGSAGTGGAGGSEAGVGGSAGEAGSAGTGGAAGSEAGVGGSAGEGGAAGTGGAAGSEAGVGGSAGEGGAAGMGGNAGSEAGVGGSAGEGGAAGQGGAAGEGGAAGTGGNVDAGPGTCFAKVDNTTNCEVTKCQPNGIEMKVAPKSSCNVSFNGMTQKLKVTNEMPSEGTFAADSSCLVNVNLGTWFDYSEQPAPGECHMMAIAGGAILGAEGSAGEWMRPLMQFNPCVVNPAQESCKGRSGVDLIDYISFKQTEGTASIKDETTGTSFNTGYDNGTLPPNNTYVHFAVKNGKLSNTADPAPDPNQGVDVPPQQVSDGGGCSICSIKTPGDGQDSTRNALMAMGLVAALAMSRRRR